MLRNWNHMYKYDFALSFAGEQREIAKGLARILQSERVRVFYDKDEEADLWGQDLFQKLQRIYGRESRFFVPFVSADYLAKRWPKHELEQAQARDIKEDVKYILPLRVDDCELPGLKDTTAYVDLRTTNIEQVARLCLENLVRDSAIRQLYLFLRESNPTAMELLEARSQQIVIRVATSRAGTLEDIIAKIDAAVCRGTNNRNCFSGGAGPPLIACTYPEPHTTFTLAFSGKFYQQIGM